MFYRSILEGIDSPLKTPKGTILSKLDIVFVVLIWYKMCRRTFESPCINVYFILIQICGIVLLIMPGIIMFAAVIFGSIYTNQIIIFCLMTISSHAAVDLLSVLYFVKTYRIYIIVTINQGLRCIQKIFFNKQETSNLSSVKVFPLQPLSR